MKTIAIVGVGMGRHTMSQQATQAVLEAEHIFGAWRMLETFPELTCAKDSFFDSAKITAAIEASNLEHFVVLVSGDVGFYSATEKLVTNLAKYTLTLIPSISSVSYFFAQLQLPWQNVKLISCHARSTNLVDTVRRNQLTFALTGGNISDLMTILCDAGFGELEVSLGENLGMSNERIEIFTVAQLCDEVVMGLAVILIKNPDADSRTPIGIANEAFCRGEVPMTKSEIRALVLSKLNLTPSATCADIGCGTGSVTVEMALAAYEGQVYALDRDPEAIDLTNRNCRKFQIGNVATILGTVPETLDALPPLDAAFIGGSSGTMIDIFDALLAKNTQTHLVITAIVLETVQETISAFKKHNLTYEICQINVAKARSVGSINMMMAENPIFIISRKTNA